MSKCKHKIYVTDTIAFTTESVSDLSVHGGVWSDCVTSLNKRFGAYMVCLRVDSIDYRLGKFAWHSAARQIQIVKSKVTS